MPRYDVLLSENNGGMDELPAPLHTFVRKPSVCLSVCPSARPIGQTVHLSVPPSRLHFHERLRVCWSPLQITTAQGVSAGSVNMRYRHVECAPPAPVLVDVDSNQGDDLWMRLTVRVCPCMHASFPATSCACHCKPFAKYDVTA
jgi:hypothetical protein